MADQKLGPFTYKETSKGLAHSVPLPAAHYFGDIDPQPDCVVTTEIASGRFEDDIRRMRMAAWHGADHMMVIRTAGQSHMDGLLEGTPEGIGGIAVTRKQVRATRRAIDLIEDEVGRPINFHSYVSGVAGPEMAVMFAEEGVNGAHQDPQYNVLYRNINMYRSFVDAAVAKHVMASVRMAQIDGAHNANATAREAWKVMPELLVQHAINCAYSEAAGMPKADICLSTVPPDSPPAPCMRMDLPYAVALRDLFGAVQDARPAEHALHGVVRPRGHRQPRHEPHDLPPDERRHPEHDHPRRGPQRALALQQRARREHRPPVAGGHGRPARVRQARPRQPRVSRQGARAQGARRAVPRGHAARRRLLRRGRAGLLRRLRASTPRPTTTASCASPTAAWPPAPSSSGPTTTWRRSATTSASTTCPRATATAPAGAGGHEHKPCDLIGGCTLCDAEKVPFTDELDPEDNVNVRLERTAELRDKGLLKPEVEWAGDGIVVVTLFLPAAERVAEFAALELAKAMNLHDPEVIHKQVMHPAEGTLVEVKGRLDVTIDPATLVIPPPPDILSADEVRAFVKEHGLKIVGATVGEDEHSVGMREIIDIKHGGLEGFGVACEYLGTSVPVEKVLDAAIEHAADAVLISTIITHGDMHRQNMEKLADLAVEKGVRDKLLLIAGGTQVTAELARSWGMDAGFGRGTKGIDVASFMVKALRERAR